MRRAFEKFFIMPAPAGLIELNNLTPGDFAVVARQVRHAPARDSQEVLERLRDESRLKPDSRAKMGF